MQSLLESKRGQKKQAWMKKYSYELTKLAPAMAGKIDWDTAAHLFNTGKDPRAAARQTAERG